MWRAIVAVWLVVLGGRAAFAQGEPRLTVAEAQRRLLRVAVPEMDAEVPGPVQAEIVALKKALGQTTDAVMGGLPEEVGAAEAQRQIAVAMPKAPAATVRGPAAHDEDQPQTGVYGAEIRVGVTEPKAGLLLVRESFGIPCGDDAVLLGYEREGGRWRRVLAWQSGRYKDISGAFGDVYETVLLGAERAGHPLLLVVHGTPWCTSTVSRFAMDVLEVGGGREPIWHGEHGYRRADDDPPLRVRRTGDGFEVRASVNSFSEEGRVARKGVMRYAVTADGVRRVEPLAMNARDTVEEWMGMPRAEAAEFADETAPGAPTWRMWETFTYLGQREEQQKIVPMANLGAVRACADGKDHFQVEVTSTVYEGAGKSRKGPGYFVQLREVPNGYRVHAVTTEADAQCGGPDLMAGQ